MHDFHITSLQNVRVKNAVKLRDRKGRQEQDRILIDGPRELERALDAGVYLVEAFHCEELCTSPDAKRVVQRLLVHGVEVLDVTADVFQKLAYGERLEGVLAVARTPRHTLADLVVGDNPLIGVLEGVEKPGNIGAVIRSADAAGISALIIADARTDLYNPNAIRASQGAIFTLPICAVTSREARAWLRQRKIRPFVARVDATTDYTQVDYSGPSAIALGSEATGLTDVWTGEDVTAIVLPMHGTSDSLNVSATAAVLFYEALRQRTKTQGIRRGRGGDNGAC